MPEFAIGDRVWHRSYPSDPAGTIVRFETVGGQRCAIVDWPDEGEMPTALAALQPEVAPS